MIIVPGQAVGLIGDGGNNEVATFTDDRHIQGEANLTFDGSTLTVTGALTVGVDDTGHDVTFYGATSGKKITWDESEDTLLVTNETAFTFGTDKDVAIAHRATSLAADAAWSIGSTVIIEGTDDHPGVAANSFVISNVTNDGDIMFAVSDAGNSIGALKLKGADGSVNVHKDLIVNSSLQVATIDYTDGDLAMTIADGGAVTMNKSASGASYTYLDGNAGQNTRLIFQEDGTAKWNFGTLGSDDSFSIYNQTTSNSLLTFTAADVVNISGDVAIKGTTPTLTIGDAGAEDTKVVFDGNAIDFYIGLDDSADDLVFGTGSTVGSDIRLMINTTGVFVGTAGNPTLDRPFRAHQQSSLGETAGDLQPIASITGLDSNADKILFDLRRVSNGSDWQTAELKIQREVDVTHMGYVSFGHGDTSAIGFGYDTTEYFSMKTAVAEKAFTISAGAAGDAVLYIEADTDNSEEGDNPRIVMKQDGGGVTGTIGILGDGGDVFTGTQANSIYFQMNGSDRDFYWGYSTTFRMHLDNGTGDLWAVGLSAGSLGVTIGDGSAEDTKIVFDGNALDFHIGLDDSHDQLRIGTGSTVGSGTIFTIDADNTYIDTHVKPAGDAGHSLGSSSFGWANLYLTDTGASASEGPTFQMRSKSASPADGDKFGVIQWIARNTAGIDHEYAMIQARTDDVTESTEDGRLDFNVYLNGTSYLVAGLWNNDLHLLRNLEMTHEGSAQDSQIWWDGNEVDFHIGLDDSANELTFGTGTALGSNNAFRISSTPETIFNANTVMLDDYGIKWGNAPDYLMYYSSANTRWAMGSYNADGSGADEDLIRIEDGQRSIDANTTWDANVFDIYDDAMLLASSISPTADAYDFGKGVFKRGREALIEVGILKEYEDGWVGYNDQRMAALLAGGIYQTRQIVDEMKEEINKLRKQVTALGG